MSVITDQFKNMTPAQKTYVLSMFVNKVFQNPTDYGLQNDGVLRVGDKLDFTNLFKDEREIKSVFDKAKQTITEGSAQEKLILQNTGKIAEWVKVNPTESLNEDKVSEILNAAPKAEALSMAAPVAITMSAPASMPEPEPNPATEEKENPARIQKEIEEAKKRLEALEENKTVRTMRGDISLPQEVERAFRSEIDSIYGKRELLGMKRVAGIDTKEWAEMAKLPASKVVEYYTVDSTKSDLPRDIIGKLSKSKQHQALVQQTLGLMKEMDDTVRPYENENMEQFIKRLGGFVLKRHMQNMQKAG